MARIDVLVGGLRSRRLRSIFLACGLMSRWLGLMFCYVD